MIFCAQYPIADIRQLLNSQSYGLLGIPKWPIPDSEDDFVRHFGGIKIRKKGGLLLLGGEDKICRAKRAVRFTQSPVFKDKSSSLTISFQTERRFFSDGKLSAKFELALSNATPYSDEDNLPPLHLNEIQTRNLINFFLDLKLRVPNFQENKIKEYSIVNIGRPISQLYNYATIQKKQSQGNINSLKKYIKIGSMLFLLEIEEDEKIDIPFPVKKIELPENYNLDLSWSYYECQGHNYPFWLIKKRQWANNETARYLRLYLLRLNAQHECLRLVLNSLSDIKITPRSKESQLLQYYIDDAHKTIRKAEKNSNKYLHEDLVKYAMLSINTIKPGEACIIEQRLKEIDCRPAVLDNAREILKKDVNIVVAMEVYMGAKYDIHNNIGGSYQIGDMKEALQIVNSSLIPAEMKELISKLADQIDQISKSSSQTVSEDVKELRSGFESLAKGIGEERQDRKWYSVTLGGIQEAAEKIGDIAKPIIETIKLLIPFGKLFF